MAWEDKEKNIENAEKIIRSLKGCDYCFFPEMSFTGFSMNTDVTAEDGEETLGRIMDIAKNEGTGIGFGWARRAGDKAENVYSIVDAAGAVVSEYTKIHPFSFSGEDKKFSSGRKIDIYTLCGIPFSTFICYDLRFPEVFRAVAESVHAVIVPACWPASRSEHWKALLKARAIEDQIYVFAINCQGNVGGQYYSGDSCVISPNGDILKSLSDTEGTIEFDFADDTEKYRRKFPVLDDFTEDFRLS